MKISKKLLTIIIIILVGGGVFLYKWASHKKGAVSVAKASARVKGPANASVQIIEFVDFQCPACAKGTEDLKGWLAKYPDQIRLELKYFPLSMHKHSFVSAVYAQCAANQDVFWPFTEEVFKHQEKWKDLEDARPVLDYLVQQAGADMEELEDCVSDEEVHKVIMKDKEEGKLLKIQSTPTYFINDEMVVGTPSLDEKLKQLLHEKQN